MMEQTHIPYARQWIADDDIRQVVQTLASDFLTTGPRVARFEAALCDLTGAGHAVVCSSGTAALHLACMALGIGSEDTGLTSPNSFLASANCIELCGGRADFVDIDSYTLCMDPEALADYCRTHSPPRVVIPVDFAGTPADLPAIQALGREYGFHIIEDAAHAIGSSYTHDNRTYQCGSCAHTDLAIFSFHPAKTITCAEGGAVMTNDKVLADRLRMLRNHGMVKSPDLAGDAADTDLHGPWYYEMQALSANFRITDVQCALGSSQLTHLNRFKDLRKKIVHTYNQAFKDDDRLILPPKALAENACPHLYPIQFVQGSRTRKKMFLKLADHKIFCQVHYIPIHLQPYYTKKYGYAQGKCPEAETYYSRTLSLPLFAALTPDQVAYVIKTVKDLL
ncbi:MAG: UDP-4-amino-4,6-dideoxy-N-acetyl-beta-L-altrosamine transaminase [Desulfotignum sp.]